ncbi:MAG: cytochrome c oxidase assembly protein [Alphaproteobacteria bacterium]|nr:cytochrome c oxidase assembly protein [Rhodospirillales bacterium]MCW9045393.1 cytochrome c oxidase assembly protein [Alphaproteobacteria bacterium]
MQNKTIGNGRLGLLLAGMAVTMIGAAYAAVPLYQLFCQVTGYGGTPARGELSQKAIGKEQVTIRFNADHSSQLPWDFKPAVASQTVHLGEENLAFFVAINKSDKPIYGTATFNVTPTKAAQYFVKTDCFCFTEQLLEPGQRVDMPVSFHIDPELYMDKLTRDVTTITLSYTFFPLPGKKAELLSAKETGL